MIVKTTEEEAKLLTVSLSRLRGRTNEEMLAALIEELTQHFALDEIAIHAGFERNELDHLLAGMHPDTVIESPVTDDEFDVQRSLDGIKEPETRYGDIWQLGRHYLMCGDTTNVSDVNALMMGIKAALVVTDPPYNVAVVSDSERLAADGREKILNDDMPDDEFRGFLDRVFRSYKMVMKEKAAIYVFHPSSINGNLKPQ